MNISTWCYFAFGPERQNTFLLIDFFSPVTGTAGYRTQIMVNLLLFALDTNKQKMPTKQKNMIYNSLQLHLFPAIYNHTASLILQRRRDGWNHFFFLHLLIKNNKKNNKIHPFSRVYCRERAKFCGCLFISWICKCRVFDLSSICPQQMSPQHVMY